MQIKINQRRNVVMMHDMLMAGVAWTLAYLLRFEFSLDMLQSIAYWQVLLITLPIYLII